MKTKATSSHRSRAAKPPTSKKGDRLRSTQDEIDFMEAIDRYRKENRRPFPTWSEVLEVLHSLGYCRKDRSPKTDRDSKNWQELCNDLKEERDRLHLELAKVKAERDQYLKAVYAMIPEEDIEVPDKKTVLAQLGEKPTLQELIAELESRGDQ